MTVTGTQQRVYGTLTNSDKLTGYELHYPSYFYSSIRGTNVTFSGNLHMTYNLSITIKYKTGFSGSPFSRLYLTSMIGDDSQNWKNMSNVYNTTYKIHNSEDIICSMGVRRRIKHNTKLHDVNTLSPGLDTRASSFSDPNITAAIWITNGSIGKYYTWATDQSYISFSPDITDFVPTNCEFPYTLNISIYHILTTKLTNDTDIIIGTLSGFIIEYNDDPSIDLNTMLNFPRIDCFLVPDIITNDIYKYHTYPGTNRLNITNTNDVDVGTNNNITNVTIMGYETIT